MYKMLNRTPRLLDRSLHQAEEKLPMIDHNNNKGDQC